MSKKKTVKAEDTYLSNEDGIPTTDQFPSKAYELYRKSDLGMSLTEVICQLVDKGFIAESAGYDILRQFDYSVIKMIRQSPSQDVVIEADKICGYRYLPKSGQIAMVLNNVHVKRMFSYADVVSFRNQENILRASNVTTSTKTEKKSRKKKKKKKAHASFVSDSSEESDSPEVRPARKSVKISSLKVGSEVAYAFQLHTKPLRRVLLMAYSALPKHFHRANPKYYKDSEEYVPCQVPLTNTHICVISYRHKPHQGAITHQEVISNHDQSEKHDEDDQSASGFNPRCEARAPTRMRAAQRHIPIRSNQLERKNKSKEVSELKEAENIASELSTLAFGSK